MVNKYFIVIIIQCLCDIVGKISTLAALDYETSTAHSVEVKVTDSTGATNATATLSVNVQDINEKHSITNLPTSLQINAQTDCPTTSNPVNGIQK